MVSRDRSRKGHWRRRERELGGCRRREGPGSGRVGQPLPGLSPAPRWCCHPRPLVESLPCSSCLDVGILVGRPGLCHRWSFLPGLAALFGWLPAPWPVVRVTCFPAPHILPGTPTCPCFRKASLMDPPLEHPISTRPWPVSDITLARGRPSATRGAPSPPPPSGPRHPLTAGRSLRTRGPGSPRTAWQVQRPGKPGTRRGVVPRGCAPL